MKNKTLYVFVILSLVLVYTFATGCTQISVPNETNTNENITATPTPTEAPTAAPEITSEENSLEAVKAFIEALKGDDGEAVKQLVSPSGFIVIRNFSSGNGARGKDVRNIYSANEIPSVLEFEVAGEIPITPSQLFMNSQNMEITDIPVVSMDNINFEFIDSADKDVYAPPTADAVDLCSEMASSFDENNQYTPKLFMLGDKEIVLTESASIDGFPNGAWAVFEKADGKYYLRAILDIR